MTEHSLAQITVRNLDPALWRELRLEAIRRDTAVGALLNEIIAQWLQEPGTTGPEA